MNVLLVEDNPSDSALMRDLFTDAQQAMTLHCVKDGHEALDFVFQRNAHVLAETPDVIVLDLGLPRISGYDVLKELKQDSRYQDIPVVILTTSCNPLDKSQCKALGADEFISKPRNLDEYEALVKKLLTNDFSQLAGKAKRAS